MQFAFTDEQAMIAETAAGFFAEHATSARTRAAMADNGVDASLWQAFTQELGLGGVNLPEAHGGAGLGMVEMAIVAEAAGAHIAALPLLAGCALAAPGILAGGTDEQRRAWLPRIASGEVIATFAGLDLLAPHGGVADLFVVDTGSAMLIVRRDHPATQVTTLATMDATRPYGRLRFDPTAAEPLADPEAARAAIRRIGAIAIAADALGGAQSCLDRTVRYAGERVQFGRTIGSFQAVKHRLADMMVAIEQARSAVYWAACAQDEAASDADLAAHAAKAFATDTYARCAGDMIQLHGGIGFTWEHDAHLFFRRAQADRTLLGTPDWHREQVARLIGLDLAA
ncbi:acyl-CoA dehydrogenase family protein [Sphingomonas sp. TDK1]|uniref:acyl-CoA dehydrogenase family protein n=1 Tax=Sphingomonas sp. TDK1 TaxID=453247 RepID=UPI0007D995AE|nr:acyl-CoA dehydrogenase family protein [Sphingomonas sp. TDK1]OAN66685.1 acyl-CoA dehydrogenase [Sphingomonas sp. TDK1]